MRYKNSTKYRRYPRLYRFSTISYQKNKKAGVALRYHFNQGLGFFMIPYNNGHIITEIAHAYDKKTEWSKIMPKLVSNNFDN